jgi:hypothetical protein
MSELRETTDGEADAIWAEVVVWWKASGWRWRDAPFAAQAAVGEYIANQKGFTFYTKENK